MEKSSDIAYPLKFNNELHDSFFGLQTVIYRFFVICVLTNGVKQCRKRKYSTHVKHFLR